MTTPELRADVHSIEPIRRRPIHRPQQMWIRRANIAPVKYARRARHHSQARPVETIAVIVIGNLIGCAIFAASR